MPMFRYKAVTAEREIVEGDMEADSELAVARRLQDLGHTPLRAEEVSGAVSQSWLTRDLLAGRAVSKKALVLITRELATLIGAGLTLERSLEVLIDVADRDNSRRLLGSLLKSIRGGSAFSDALAEHEGTFPGYYVSLVQAGEAGGALATVLDGLADYLEKSQAVVEEVRSALVYPVLLLIMAGGSVAILMTVVIPEFRPLFEDAGDALPLATRAMLAVADFVEQFWWALLTILVLGTWLLRQQLRKPGFRLLWDRAILRLPLFGGLVRKIQVARFSRTLGTLLSNGITLLNALRLVRGTIGNAALARAVDGVAGRLKEGERLAELLAASQAFPSLAVHLVRVGEETGRLEPMLLKVAEIYDGEVKATVERLLALLVPLLTIGLGVLIAGIIASVLLALLSLNQLAF